MNHRPGLGPIPFACLVGSLVSLAIAPERVRAAESRPFLVSGAGEELMLQLWNEGHFRDHVVVRAVAERHRRLHAIDPDVEHVHPPRLEVGPVEIQAMGPDAIVNDRSLSTCICSSRPLTQSEPSIAALDRFVVASWNDRRGTCPGQTTGGAAQGLAYSVDHGATFKELDLIRGSNEEVFHGDPTVAVNGKTGDFYVSGIIRTRTSTFLGVGVVRGRFVADSFVIDLRRSVALSSGGDFYDKSWMAVDSVSGRVHVTWTNIHADGASGIEIQSYDANLEPVTAIREVRHQEPGAAIGPQGSYPTVGPEGELYLPWGYYYFPPNGTYLTEPSAYEYVRSDDFGDTFGPVQTIASFFYHIEAAAPGYQRGFWGASLAMAIDHTHGPHRGRTYVVWSEIPDLRDAVFDTTVTHTDQEPNDFFANATPVVLGQRIWGTLSGRENDLFKFSGTRGQTIVFEHEYGSAANARFRVLCPSDTSAVANYRALVLQPRFTSSLPYDGDYYVQIEAVGNGVGQYRMKTGIDVPSATERSRDIRDHFLSYSDDGLTWSTPVRLNDDPAGFDGLWPQVVVDGRGRVHASWFDWRDDPECGAISSQYFASSGDGGVTWGPNRRMTDAPSFWGPLASCSQNNMGDYTQMATAGDWIYSTFPDSRLGDPDVFLDASRFEPVAACAPDVFVRENHETVIDFTLANHGNFETSLAWSLSDDAGWIAAVTPARSGEQSLAADSGSVVVQATIDPPASCDGDSTIVRFVTRDPHVPGRADTCVTVVRCQTLVSTLVSFAGAEVSRDRVVLRWQGASLARAEARISRRSLDGGAWIARGSIVGDGAGRFTFEDREVPPGRHRWRFETSVPGTGEPVTDEVAVEVPELRLAVRASAANPSASRSVAVTLTLPAAVPARLELVDVAGRRVAWRNVGSLGAGTHDVRLGEDLPGGVYLVRLSDPRRAVTAKLVMVP